MASGGAGKPGVYVEQEVKEFLEKELPLRGERVKTHI